MKNAIRYAVAGGGRFPLDMLRYDRAYPASETDSNAANGDWEEGLRIVVIAGEGCTHRRWESFGWKVVVYPEQVMGYQGVEDVRRMAEHELRPSR